MQYTPSGTPQQQQMQAMTMQQNDAQVSGLTRLRVAVYILS